MNPNWKLILQIFMTFLKIGPITFGGGYAMIPMIEREVVTKKKWLENREVADIFAIAGSAPGAIAINSAVFIGYRIAKIRGAFAALFGVLLPTFLIVILLSITFIYVKANPIIEAAFEGIRPAVVALIAFAGYKIGLTALYDKATIVTAILTIVALFYLNIHPALIIIIGIITGIILVKVKNALGFTTKLEKDSNTKHKKKIFSLTNSRR
ncbi:chromate transporter [Lederbergia wuyishanensis]|uniref:Chromate transporter n=1 Tax=Lederbergia wuyishanensis TaxID=1347903 RepID=A0ABU0D201_9BACI|nr:chromate transporter [Lederbergia wuyishanensis]MCJ8007018.1 chromate transporter [Lederbergia wuyishanensis]MDQ0342402.1 chromate transporter [Lederbergia wuyishanensis]